MGRVRCGWVAWARMSLTVIVYASLQLETALAWDEFEDDAALTGGRAQLGEVSDGGKSLDLAIAGGGELMDAVLAGVDGEPLTMEDLRQFIASHGEDAPKNILADRAGLKNAVREMVTHELLQREAKSAGLAVSSEEVTAYIEEIKKQNGVDDAGFAALLSRKQLTVEGYRAQVQADILRTRIMSSRVRAKVNITDGDVEKYLEEHPQSGPGEGEVRVLQATFRAPTADAAEQLANEFKEKVEDGAEFAGTAGDAYTDLGFVDPADLRDDLRKAVEDLDVGELSDVLPGEGSATVVTVASKHADGAQVDEKVKADIRKQLFEERFKGALERFLAEELPKKYHVEYKL